MRIVLEAAQQSGCAVPAAALVTQHLEHLNDAGDAGLDSSSVFKVIAGLSVAN
jgi:3-hydroxyisobutyrate dehydrogenase-like beta-hydroxyacid dehydrogenase